MSQLSLDCDTSKLKKISCDLMPCAIRYTGQAKVSNYFKPLVKETDDHIWKSSFRGKPLKGIKVNLNQTWNIVFDLTSDCDNQKLKPIGQFDEINFWNWDTKPSVNDTFLQALNWFSISEAIHKNVKLEDLH